ncbi:hypothetical protein P2H44_11415 [Albimonas sp. CAU 1670]|uniref:hypothetical protein n=1 Tax=Albimonas sp. CAU 1670 TaxID=3032599 RepID=UPI0023DB4A6C|nr:hypothetical protein [Albimonas sp. CAU 1670]MDF2233160.1 hypothetical protein [Albimonas sp. CAU 1670]
MKAGAPPRPKRRAGSGSRTRFARRRSGGSAIAAPGRAAIAGLALLGLAGCGVQASVIQARHWDLNEMMRQTTNEQLLLNIVRLRYDETPYFLQIGSVTTSFSAGANAGAQATLPDGAPNVLGLSAGVSYAETPTVTWGLPDSRELLGRLHAPMGADQLTVLTQSGLSPASVLRIGAKKINRLRNLEFDLERGSYEPDSYGAFVEALDLLGTLLREGLVDLSYGVYSNAAGGKIPMSKIDPVAMAEALPSGMQFMTRDNPNVFEPLKLSKPLFLRFTRGSAADPRVLRLRDLLDLDPERQSFAIIDTGGSGTEELLSESGRQSRVLDDAAPLREIVLNNRSVMEVLRFASAYVAVPQRDLAAGIVRPRSAPARVWLDVETSDIRPSDAWLAVERDGRWFYIRADDLDTRIGFTLLNALFDSVVGEVPGAKPLLTLPVK